MIAALYVAAGGCYDPAAHPELAGVVDPWPESRDARRYAGPHPVVAHPPCARWCILAGFVESRFPHLKRGEDGGCFASALAAVRRWGGVLEHPAHTKAWPALGLPSPRRGWSAPDLHGGRVCALNQAAYGHSAPKATWLYYVGPEPPALLFDAVEAAQSISTGLGSRRTAEADGAAKRRRAEQGGLANLAGFLDELASHKARLATPPAFRDALLSLARLSVGRP